MRASAIHFIFLWWGFFFCSECKGQLKNNEKLTPLLKHILSQEKDLATLQIFITVRDLQKLRDDKEIQIVSEYRSTNTALVKIKKDKLSSLLDKKELLFADVYRKPKEEVTTGSLDISLNKINLEHSIFPDINGDLINISIKEQRFDTTDIDIKGRTFESVVAASVQSSHATTMTTIVAGAGNTSPFAKGVAWASNLTSSDYTTLFPDADNVYRQYRISVQNHSYGTDIENYYGADAASYDMSVWNNPVLLHIFSSGNLGENTSASGTYSGITGFANLTGSFKMAKNIITVGATDSFNIVAALSSKGPAFDGRVRPELVAFGEDGSSGAAALTSGTAALVQQAYRSGTNNLPSAALVKAVLLNSADDIGEKHIDFISGYGSVNAFAAVNTVKENRFFEGSVVQNEIKNFPISVPSGIRQLKITITWMDTAAIPNVAKALVNDIDAVLQLPLTGESWQPWVLSSVPKKDSLLLPAARRRDTLNNTEQISLDNPQPGNYLVQIKGGKIQTSVPQSFAVAYQFDTVNSFRWTYPNTNDVLTASKQNVIRWQTNIVGNASIEYSANGTQWQTIAPSISLATQYFKWNVPDTFATGFLRMNFGSQPPAVSNSFVISKPVSIEVGFNCPDSFLLYWNKFKTSQYQLYRLGAKYLEPLQIVADSFVVFQKQSHPDLYYSIAPIIDSKPGLRSFTINYTTQGAGCYVRTFFALLQNANAALLTTELGTLYNVSEVSFQKITATGIQTLHTISNPLSLSLSFTDQNLTQGANVYRFQVKLRTGNTIYSDTDLVYYFPVHPVIVYPNPANKNQSIKIIAQDPGVYSISIYNVGGQIVHQKKLTNITQQLASVYLPAGVYVVKVFDENKNAFTQKLIVY